LAYASPSSTKQKENGKLWLDWLEGYFQTMRKSDGSLIPILVTIGNHDVKGHYHQTPEQAPYYYTLFPMPGKPGYNVVRFGSYMSIFLLDSGHTNPINGEQTLWLKNELSKHQDVLHRFAIYHVPAYPSVRNYRMDISKQIRRHWLPLFEKYELHVAFENNDHAYKRTFPMIESSIHPRGVVYIGDGSWGVKPRSPKKAKQTSYLAKSSAVRQFIRVDISSTKREFTVISNTGLLIDHYAQQTTNE